MDRTAHTEVVIRRNLAVHVDQARSKAVVQDRHILAAEATPTTRAPTLINFPFKIEGKH